MSTCVLAHNQGNRDQTLRCANVIDLTGHTTPLFSGDEDDDDDDDLDGPTGKRAADDDDDDEEVRSAKASLSDI